MLIGICLEPVKKDYRKKNGDKLSKGSVYRYVNGIKLIAKDAEKRNIPESNNLLEIESKFINKIESLSKI